MKLSFSTRGWGGSSWNECVETALDMGFNGIEVYNLQKFPQLTDKGGPFHKYNMAATLRHLYEKKLSIPCFDTSCDISREDCVRTLTDLMQTARSMQIPCLAVCALHDDESRVKEAANLPELGIKTYFCSNVCAAYRRALYVELGGFTKKTIFNEDMIYAAKLIQNGYGVAYVADARVVHSHNYTGAQQFCRNFDLAVSQKDHPEVFEGIRSEGEGIRLVKKTAEYLVKQGKIHLVPQLVYMSGCKYLGYLLGKRYRKLPKCVILKCTMNKNYWKG